MKSVKFIMVIVVMLACVGGCSDDECICVNFTLQENSYLNCDEKLLESQLGIPEQTRDLVLNNGWLCFARQRKLNLGIGASVREKVFQCGNSTLFAWLRETNQVWRVVYAVLVPDGISL